MKAFVLVTVDQGPEEMLGVFTSTEGAKAGLRAIAKLRQSSITRFNMYPIELDELTVKK